MGISYTEQGIKHVEIAEILHYSFPNAQSSVCPGLVKETLHHSPNISEENLIRENPKGRLHGHLIIKAVISL